MDNLEKALKDLTKIIEKNESISKVTVTFTITNKPKSDKAKGK